MISPEYWHKHRAKVMLPWINKLWWRFMPGVTVNVKWPVGNVVIDESMPQWDWTLGPSKYLIESADPNDHYRPWMEQHVGRQGWDWDWGMVEDDIARNRLTIKFRRSKQHFASIVSLKWS